MVLFFGIIVFSIGYEFTSISASIAVLAIWLLPHAPNHSTDFPQKLRKRLIATGIIIISIAIPFTIRQIQVATVMGTEFWLKDFLYSFAIKVPGATAFLQAPSLEEINALYRSANVLRPSASAGTPFHALVEFVIDLFTISTLPSTGILAFGLMLGVALLGMKSGWLYRNPGDLRKISARLQWPNADSTHYRWIASTIFAIALSVVLLTRYADALPFARWAANIGAAAIVVAVIVIWGLAIGLAVKRSIGRGRPSVEGSLATNDSRIAQKTKKLAAVVTRQVLAVLRNLFNDSAKILSLINFPLIFILSYVILSAILWITGVVNIHVISKTILFISITGVWLLACHTASKRLGLERNFLATRMGQHRPKRMGIRGPDMRALGSSAILVAPGFLVLYFFVEPGEGWSWSQGPKGWLVTGFFLSIATGIWWVTATLRASANANWLARTGKVLLQKRDVVEARQFLRSGYSDLARFVTVLLVGSTIGIAVFSPLTLYIYLKHQAPLLAAPLLIAKGLVVGWLILFAVQGRKRAIRHVVAGILATAILLDHAAIQVQNFISRTEMDVSWIPAVKERSDATFAVSWIAPSVAALTNNWAVGILPGNENNVIERISKKNPPFKQEDLFYFGEKSENGDISMYLQPDFWLYLRTKHIFDYDNPLACPKYDYMSGAIRFIYRLVHEAPPPIITYRQITRIAADAPGARIHILGNLRRVEDAVRAVEAGAGSVGSPAPPPQRKRTTSHQDGEQRTSLAYDCRRSRFYGEIQLPVMSQGETRAGPITLPIYVTYEDGREFLVDTLQIDLAELAHIAAAPALPHPQPTIGEVRDLLPNELHVTSVGSDHILVDLRSYYEKSLYKHE